MKHLFFFMREKSDITWTGYQRNRALSSRCHQNGVLLRSSAGSDLSYTSQDMNGATRSVICSAGQLHEVAAYSLPQILVFIHDIGVGKQSTIVYSPGTRSRSRRRTKKYQWFHNSGTCRQSVGGCSLGTGTAAEGTAEGTPGVLTEVDQQAAVPLALVRRQRVHQGYLLKSISRRPYPWRWYGGSVMMHDTL